MEANEKFDAAEDDFLKFNRIPESERRHRRSLAMFV